MISNLDKNTITLKEEIDFLNSYFYLLKKRMESKIELKIEVDQDHLDFHLPPLTLQLLVENAVKHNIATFSNPLTIFIYSEGNNLIVKNALQQTSGKSLISTGIGQKNVKFRYKILFNRKPIFSEVNGFYMVQLPLI